MDIYAILAKYDSQFAASKEAGELAAVIDKIGDTEFSDDDWASIAQRAAKYRADGFRITPAVRNAIYDQRHTWW